VGVELEGGGRAYRHTFSEKFTGKKVFCNPGKTRKSRESRRQDSERESEVLVRKTSASFMGNIKYGKEKMDRT